VSQHLAIVRPGRLEMLDPRGWREALSRYEGRQIQIEVHGCRRSNAQNRRYWGRIVHTLRKRWSVGREIPLSKTQVHILLVKTFLGEDETPLGFVPMETKNLPSQKFSDYMDEIEGHFTAEGVDFEDEDVAA
jgi:hypothetical protein